MRKATGSKTGASSTKSSAKKKRLSKQAQARIAARKLIEAKIILEDLKEYYEQINEATLKLVELGVTDMSVNRKLDGKLYRIKVKDNFSEKNTVFKATGVSRFEASVDCPDLEKEEE